MKAAIFDMDGLMLDTEPMYQRAWHKAADELGYKLEEHFYLSLIGRNNIESESMLMDYFGGDFPMLDFQKMWASNWKNEAEEFGVSRKPGLTELLNWLEKSGIPIAVATSSEPDYAALSLMSAGLGSEFKHIVTGDQVANGKPAPDIFLQAASRLGTAPEACVAFEDSEAGVMSASAAGMKVYLIPDLKLPSKETQLLAFRVASSLHEALNELQADCAVSEAN